MASVVTLGSASDRSPDLATRIAMMTASPWFVAGDGDPAGEANASDWMSRSGRCVRARPPLGDWTEARGDGYRLGQWWAETIAGRDPDRFDPTWYELSDIWK